MYNKMLLAALAQIAQLQIVKHCATLHAYCTLCAIAIWLSVTCHLRNHTVCFLIV